MDEQNNGEVKDRVISFRLALRSTPLSRQSPASMGKRRTLGRGK